MANMRTARREPIGAYNFVVMIDKSKIGFSKISSFEVGYESEVLVEGGVNGKVQSLYSPQKNEGTVVMERGAISAANKNDMDLLQKLRAEVKIPNASIGVMDTAGKLVKFYALRNLKVKKWKLSDLDASQSSFLIESFEFAYEEIEEVEIPKG